ncbi:MAG: hypothetical protein P8013_07240 [Candidatus Sulfobium sp.]|jgi:hypothetical protein
MSEETRDRQVAETMKTCGLCSHMRIMNKGKIAECEMKGKGVHPNIKFQRKPNNDFDTFAWLKARDCAYYDGDEDDTAEGEVAGA